MPFFNFSELFGKKKQAVDAIDSLRIKMKREFYLPLTSSTFTGA